MTAQRKSKQNKIKATKPKKIRFGRTSAAPGSNLGAVGTEIMGADLGLEPGDSPAEHTPEQVSAQRLEANRNKQRSQSKLVRQSLKRDREFEISYKQILLAADQGKKWAIVELGAYAEYLRDYRRSIEQYEKLAVQGDLYYMRRIAVIYEQSLEDIHSAIDWYTEAGHYGDEYSMIRAGNLLELHFEDYDEAVAWYRKAAQMDSLPAIYQLCRIYQHNLNNFDTAIEWYRRAVQLGDLKAAIALGQLYENSLKDYAKAIEWYSMAAGHKNLYAVNLLCQLYETKLRDYPRAIEWYKMAITLYNEQNGSDVVAADSQGQQSIDTAQMPYTSDASDSSGAFGAFPGGMHPSEAAYASQPGATPVPPPAPQAGPGVPSMGGLAGMPAISDNFDDGLLPHPSDLTPAELASASPGLNDEAEVEFLG
ncbi:tetratricopeptide repeat protein [Candidatus Haliotispira prima]|uniref:Tetratricopeptide repeat protein n=1 Tax=Candidatus Haliotispira prima TaxID=3034016 RepID=A0ABY8MGE0_9SPIO|nr:tetratricopeptide repeat protein [Candidatus Haliotispira prima]